MPMYVVSYDLVALREKYKTLYDKLRNLNGKRILQSVWLIEINMSAECLAAQFDDVIGRDDGIWVSEISNMYFYKATPRPRGLI